MIYQNSCILLQQNICTIIPAFYDQTHLSHLLINDRPISFVTLFRRFVGLKLGIFISYQIVFQTTTAALYSN